jgi:catechol 2,3-dioxygenase-like lactoylglutathione lyase family enzyme
MSPLHRLALSTLVVRDYDEAICYFVDKLGFTLVADTLLEHGKRWVVVSPSQSDRISAAMNTWELPFKVHYLVLNDGYPDSLGQGGRESLRK